MNVKRARISLRLYTWLLYLYPKPFRDVYGAELLQIFKDCCREIEGQGSRAAIVRLWLLVFPDIIVNACLERLRQMAHRDWWWGTAQTIGRLAGLLTMVISGALFGWVMMAITVFLLIPWDVGIPPEGTLAASINNFFESSGMYYGWSAAILACESVAFVKVVLGRRYSLSLICWRFTLLNLVATLIAALLAIAGMLAARAVFPNMNVWEGDQSYGVALVYWGLILMGGVTAFFVRQAWFAPPGLPFTEPTPYRDSSG